MPVHGENTVRGWIVNYGVRALSGGSGAEDFECFQVEDGDGAGSTVAGEAAPEVTSDGNAVHALGVGDIADHSVSIRIHHHHVRSAGNKNVAIGTVYIKVVPKALTSQNNFLNQVVVSRRGRNGARQRKNRQKDCEKKTRNTESWMPHLNCLLRKVAPLLIVPGQ